MCKNMSLTKETAFDILGLPTFATADEITLRYKFLALSWFPERYSNAEFAVQEFRNITLATIKLLTPESWAPRKLKLIEMYGFFQHIFFGHKKDDDDDYSDYDDDYSDTSLTFEDAIEQEIRAEDNAEELIQEEAREKEKAQKRKAKKKRRKERKKQAKQVQETIAPQKQQSNGSLPASSSKALKQEPIPPETDSESDPEEDLDTTSAFISVVARKHNKNKPIPPKTPVIQPKSPQKLVRAESPRSKEERIKMTNETATRGNAMANVGNFDEAVNLFTECIQIDSTDHRFYNNRSYCYERLNLYDKALKDAETAISLDSSLPKGYYRRGRAYLGLKKFLQAEESFLEVLKRDCDSEDAKEELRKARVSQLMEIGYSRAHSETAISKCDSISKALGRLKAMGVPLVKTPAEDIFISDEEIEANFVTPKVAKSTPLPYDIKKDPRNPEQHNSLWIGNVQPDVTERQLKMMFSKFGELVSVKAMPEKFCAFINYKSKASPGKAMEAYQGHKLSGYNLEIRFPNLPGETLVKKKPEIKPGGTSAIPPKIKYKEPVNGTECYFWRTTGCIHGAGCRFEHLPQNKGIDKKGWM